MSFFITGDLGLPCTPDQLKKDKLSLIPTTGKTVGQTVPAAAKAYVSRFNVICPATKKLAEMKTIRMSKACMKVRASRWWVVYCQRRGPVAGEAEPRI